MCPGDVQENGQFVLQSYRFCLHMIITAGYILLECSIFVTRKNKGGGVAGHDARSTPCVLFSLLKGWQMRLCCSVRFVTKLVSVHTNHFSGLFFYIMWKKFATNSEYLHATSLEHLVPCDLHLYSCLVSSAE